MFINRLNFHGTKQNRSFFDPFKPKAINNQKQKEIKSPIEKPKINNAKDFLLKNRLGIPESARLIYLADNPKIMIGGFMIIKTMSLFLLGMIGYGLYSGQLNEKKVKELFQIKPDQKVDFFELKFALGVMYIFIAIAIAAKYQNLFVISLYHDAMRKNYHLVYINKFFRLSSEIFEKEAMQYRYDPAFFKNLNAPSSLKQTILKNFGNFLINGKLRSIEPKSCLNSDAFEELTGQRVYNILRVKHKL